MQERNLRWFFVSVCLGLVSFSTPASGSATASVNLTIDWNTFTTGLDVGMNLEWKKLGSLSTAGVYYNKNQKDSQDSASDDWGDTSAAASFDTNSGSVTALGSTTAETIQTSADAFSDGDGRLDGDSHGWGENRWGKFIVTGSGNVTFSVDYSASITLNETEPRPWDVCSALVEMDLWLNYVVDPLEPQEGNTYPWWDDREKWIPDWDPPLNDTWSETGTLTVTLWFENGQEGVMRAGAASCASAASIPEPMTIGLLALGGLTLMRCRNNTGRSPMTATKDRP